MNTKHQGLLPPHEARARLQGLTDWTLSEDGRAITRNYTFADFSQAFAFMARVALAAEKLDHHPDWCNVYNRIDVRLSTHDADGLTDKDFILAQTMDSFV